VRERLDTLLAFAFSPPSAGRWRQAQAVFLACAFLGGGAFWWSFFSCDEPEPFFHALDWRVEQQYYHVIQEAWQTHHTPYHVSDPVQPLRPTQRFMAVPESLYWLAPQAPLLNFLTLKQFVIANVLLHFAIGFWGCLLLRRRFNLAPAAFLILVLLFNLNGHIIAHVAAGHHWNGYFYLTFFVAFVLDALDQRKPVFETAAKLALVNLFILLQGTIHIYALCMLFLGLMFVFSARARWTALLAGVVTGVLSVFRLAPAALSLGKLSATEFEPGYGSVRSILDRLDSSALLKTATFPWEYDFYIGLVGVSFLLIFAVWLAFSKRPELASTTFRGLHLPLLVILLFSLGDFYQQFLHYLPGAVPNTERVPSRFLILPLVFLLAVACIRFQRLHQHFIRIRWLGCGLLVALAGLLLQLRYHWALWRLNSIEHRYTSLSNHLPIPHIIQLDDPGYLRAVHLTLALSALALLILLGTLLWRRLRRPVSEWRDVQPPAPDVSQADRRHTVRWAVAIGGLWLAISLGAETYRLLSPAGLWVTYYENSRLHFPAWRGVERDLVRNFQDDPPVPWIIPRGFSERWTGWLMVPRDDDYIFHTQSSDGIRLYLDDRCVLDNWRKQDFPASGKAVQLHLTAGAHSLKVEHYTTTRAGALRVRWCGGGIPENTNLGAPYLRKRL
jgi:hypothetical protein